ncbi:hypothetical protein BRARA_B01303 [Brassica rapa]|uniref:Uncharacterized protein n=1 Tax=Brassica campestris TaxID=3711 RepID=A0A398AC24_BRACM|nr:hypothetical protein BRARA_B01303 [Brassica rapa]
MLCLQASFCISLISFYISHLSFVNLNSASDSNSGLCTLYPCNRPPQPPPSTGYSPYGNPPPPSPPRSRCPPVPPTGCCNQPPPSTHSIQRNSSLYFGNYSPPYPYFYTPPYPYGTLGGGESGGGQGGGGGTGAAVAHDSSSSVTVYVLMIVVSCAFVVF